MLGEARSSQEDPGRSKTIQDEPGARQEEPGAWDDPGRARTTPFKGLIRSYRGLRPFKGPGR